MIDMFLTYVTVTPLWVLITNAAISIAAASVIIAGSS